MKNLQWTYVDKEKWAIGEWNDEPDKMQFTDKETGFPCLIVRQPQIGHLCGYVGVTKEHPFFGLDYSDNKIKTNIHGGLTFSDSCQERDDGQGVCHIVQEGEDDNVWWFGFDCGHTWDVAPYSFFSIDDQASYKNIKYVKKEIKNLAIQLREAQHG